MSASPLRLVPKDSTTNVLPMPFDPTAKIRRALNRMAEHRRARLAAGDRRGAQAQAREARVALAEVGELVAIVGLHLPVRSHLQDRISEVLDALDRATGRAGGGA